MILIKCANQNCHQYVSANGQPVCTHAVLRRQIDSETISLCRKCWNGAKVRERFEREGWVLVAFKLSENGETQGYLWGAPNNEENGVSAKAAAYNKPR